MPDAGPERFPQEFTAEHAAWSKGYDTAVAACDAKLAEALAGLTSANNGIARALGQRDAILEEYARVCWTQAAQGIMAAGFHPPETHRNPKFHARIGPIKCRRCTDSLKPWDKLSVEDQQAKMKTTWDAVMKVRQQRGQAIT